MPHAFFHSTRPLLFAHRGGGGLAPENTIAAFDQAAALGVDGLELDVRLSRDGVVMVHHDPTLERTTDLRGTVAHHTADELARADAAYRFTSPAGAGMPSGAADRTLFPLRGQGVQLPTLAAVLRRYREQRIIIELKLNEPQLARAVLDVVRAADAAERVCLGSFGRRVLRAVREDAPHVATSAAREEVRWALYRSWIGWPVKRVAYGGYQVPELAGATRVVSPRFVAAAHEAGLGVQVWTVDDPSDARRLLDWGADALISDRPDLLKGLMRERTAG